MTSNVLKKTDLFIKLSNPNKETGVSRWVDVSEFVGEYAGLKFGNGVSWTRKESTLTKKYIVEFDKSKAKGNRIDHKNGMKNEDWVMKNEAQQLDDFQPLSKAANDAKRQFCK